ncbi:MAG: DnaJ domain-containing protein [Acidobacteria bacterium]|nr:DnaJ domain-containing protein [Acidobacteriota bacterium]MCW5948677.1 DnaJ domain-containing protein [Pyrinomonadaceae bacterium]
MTQPSDLEIRGDFRSHPFAELTAEISAARLSGSLRFELGERKFIVYFRMGKIVFAVSNARKFRLFEMLINRGRMVRDDVIKAPNFANDHEFAQYLRDTGFLSHEECQEIFQDQVRAIISEVMLASDGQWVFSPLNRVRDGLEYDCGETKLLVNMARGMANGMLLERFRNIDEAMSLSEAGPADIELLPAEIFALRQLDLEPKSIRELVDLSLHSTNDVTNEQDMLRALYVLWIAGLAVRHNWNPAISGMKVAAIRNAKLDLIREAAQPVRHEALKANPAAGDAANATEPNQPEPEPISLEDYLQRVESAATFYDVLGIEHDAPSEVVRQAYFSLAKRFHPDRFHGETGVDLKRIQDAFAELASAYDSLRSADTRELYDYRVRKELAEKEKARAAGMTVGENNAAEQALASFERGFSMLMDGDHTGALPFLARAVHFDDSVARFRAYYGKALSYDDKKRHKAESEMQAALRIDPNNATFRIMLAEFFIKMNLIKRAEGELNRLLAVHPDNREGRDLLASIRG